MGKNNKLIDYFLFHRFFVIATEKYSKEWDEVKIISRNPPHILSREIFNQYDSLRFDEIKKMSDFHKLTYFKFPENLKGTIYEHIKLEQN